MIYILDLGYLIKIGIWVTKLNKSYFILQYSYNRFFRTDYVVFPMSFDILNEMIRLSIGYQDINGVMLFLELSDVLNSLRDE